MSRRYRVGTGLPDFPTNGTEEQRQLLLPLHRAINALAQQVSDLTGMTEVPKEDIQGLLPGIEHDGFRTRKFNFKAQEDISYGRSIFLDGTAGESKIWLADSTVAVNRRAHGVCVEPGGITTGERGRVVLFQGLVTGVSGLTSGTLYWLATAGTVTNVQPVGPVYFAQAVGIAISPNTLVVNIDLIS